MKIRNKKTGEIKEVSMNELNQYGLGGQHNKLVKYQNKGEVKKDKIKQAFVTAYNNYHNRVFLPETLKDRQNAYDRIRPSDYLDFNNYARWITNNQREEFDDPRSEEGFRIYLGLEDNPKYFSKSSYSPSINKNPNVKNYYKVDPQLEEEIFNTFKDKVKLNEVLKTNEAEVISKLDDSHKGYFKENGKEFIAPVSADKNILFGRPMVSNARVLGNFNVSHGKDKQGEYISYSDEYDFPSIFQETMKGVPYSIYNRIYYPKKQTGGEMIKRADGSYSRRGLWDNIRANAGSGKRPTKEMLNQERKIRNQHQAEYGMEVMGNGGLIKYQEGKEVINPNNPIQLKEIVIKPELSFEQKIDRWLGNPMAQAERDAEVKKWFNPKTKKWEREDPIDNVRHTSAGRYVAEAIANKTGNIPYVSNTLGYLGSNLLGAAHEASTYFVDPRWNDKKSGFFNNFKVITRTGLEDLYNNNIGAMIGLTPFTPSEKTRIIKNLSNNNLIPDGYGEADPFHKGIKSNYKQGGQKMPPQLAYARFAAAGNLNQLGRYGYQDGGDIPTIEGPSGYMNEDNVWVVDNETIKKQAQELGAKKVLTEGGSLIIFDDNWNIVAADDNPDAPYKQGGSVTLNAGGENHRIYVKTTNRGEGEKGHIMVNHPTMDKGMWDTIDLTQKSGATTIAQGVAATKKWHKENPYMKKYGGNIPMFQPGGEENKWYYPKEVISNERPYYYPPTETLYLNPDYNNEPEVVRQHELFHHFQKINGRSQRPEYYPGPLKEPNMMMNNDLQGAYWNRKTVDVNNLMDQVIKRNPDFQFYPKDLFYNKVIDDLEYDTPGTLENEATQYEDYVRNGGKPMFNNGGLVKYKEKGEVKKTKSAFVVKKPVYEYKPQNLVAPSFSNLGQTTYASAPLTNTKEQRFLSNIKTKAAEERKKLAAKKSLPSDVKNMDQIVNQENYIKLVEGPKAKKPYAIVDKVGNVIRYYDENHKMIKEEPVITGESYKDVDKELSWNDFLKLHPTAERNSYLDYLQSTDNKTTPAGLFKLHYKDDVLENPSTKGKIADMIIPGHKQKTIDARSHTYGNSGKMFTLESQYGIPSSKAIHGTGYEDRLAAFINGTDRNLSNGCINVAGKTICFDFLKEGSNLYVLPEKNSGLVTYKNSLYGDSGKADPVRTMPSKRVNEIRETKNKFSNISKAANLGLTENELNFATSVAEKESQGGRSMVSKIESNLLPGNLASSYGKFEMKESWPWLKGGNPNNDTTALKAIRDFYRERYPSYERYDNKNLNNSRLYTEYNTGKRNNEYIWGEDYFKNLYPLTEYDKGGNVPMYGPGGFVAKPTASDSLAVMNSALAVQKYYDNLTKKGWYKKPNVTRKGVDEFFDPISLKEIEKRSLATYTDHLTKPSFYMFSTKDVYPKVTKNDIKKKAEQSILDIKNKKPNTYIYKDLIPLEIDEWAPPTLIDMRIKPQTITTYEVKNSNYMVPGGGYTKIMGYDPIAVKPAAMKTAADWAYMKKTYGTKPPGITTPKPTTTKTVNTTKDKVTTSVRPKDNFKRIEVPRYTLDIPKVVPHGELLPIPQMQLKQQGTIPFYGPGNTIIGYTDDDRQFYPLQYSGAKNNQVNLQDKELLANPELLQKYVQSKDNYKFAEGGGIPERYRNMGFTNVGAKKQSTRPGKKWMVLAKKGDDYKVVHGGYKGMQDFKQHHSEQRKENFWSRMGGRNSSKATDPFSPLYWHKRFGTWEYGGQPMAVGGQNVMNPIVKKDNRNWLEYLKN